MTKKKYKPRRGQATRWEFKKQHWAQVWVIMQPILHGEKWNTVLTDRMLSHAIRQAGTYCTPIIARNVRLKNNVPNSDQRKVLLYGEKFRK